MRKVLILLFFVISGYIGNTQTLTDTGSLRNYINTYVIPNGSKAITGQKMNAVLNGFLNVLSGVGGNLYSNTFFVKTVDSLKYLSTIAYLRAYVDDSVRGGFFIAKLKSDGWVVDSGMVFPSSNPGIVWVRNISETQALNIRWFGAKGLGASSLKEDTAAIRNAFRFDKLNNNRYPIYIPEALDVNGKHSFYAFAGDPIWVGDNLIIYGDGKGKSEIKLVDPLSAVNGYKGTVFIFSTYGATTELSPFQPSVPKYDLYAGNMTDTFVVLRNPANSATLHTGEIVYYGWGITGKGADTTKLRYKQSEQNMISRISNSGDTIFFVDPILIDLYDTISGEHPRLHDIIGDAGFSANTNLPNALCKNVIIRNLTLTQGHYNEIDDAPIRQSLVTLWQPGGCYNCTFEHLLINDYSGLGGNMWTKTIWNDIDCHAEAKLFDFGYGSSRNTISNINYFFFENPASDAAPTLMVINDNCHDMKFDNIICVGDNYRGNQFLTISGGSQRITINNIKFDFKNYAFNNVGINITGDSSRITKYITLDGVIINADEMGMAFRIAQDLTSADSNNIVVKNVWINSNLLGYDNSPLYTFTYTATTAPFKNDVYSNNGSTFRYRGTKHDYIGNHTYVSVFTRVSGTNAPNSSGTLTRVSGNGQSSITYSDVTATDPLPSYALQIQGTRGISVSDFHADHGKLYLERDSGVTMLQSTFTDSVIVKTTAQHSLGVTAPTANTLLLGPALSIIGGVGYINGAAIGSINSLNQTYSGTDTWNGTQPTGTPTKTYSYVRNNDGTVLLTIQIDYPNAGVGNSSVDLTWPSGVPLPLEQAPYTGVNDIMIVDRGQLGTGHGNLSTTGGSAIIKTGSNTYKITVFNSSINARNLWVKVTYIAAN